MDNLTLKVTKSELSLIMTCLDFTADGISDILKEIKDNLQKQPGSQEEE